MTESNSATDRQFEGGPNPVRVAVESSDGFPAESSSDSALTGDAAWTDWIGIVASIGCAIHCAAMPFAIALLPSLGVSFLADQSFHRVMAVTCSAIAAVAFIPGWRLHRSLLPISVAGVGLTMITGAAFFMEDDCCAACVLPAVATSDACDAHCHEHDHAEHDHSVAEGEHCCEHGHAEHEHGHAEHDHSHAAHDHVAHADCCEAEDAEHGHCCERELAEHEEPAISRSAETAEVASLIPFVTPLGGLLLVSAHLTNRRFSCRCGCCDADADAEDTAAA